MINNFHAEAVPADGPLSLGAVYKRSDLHKRFHGNHNAGIVPSKREPAVLLSTRTSRLSSSIKTALMTKVSTGTAVRAQRAT